MIFGKKTLKKITITTPRLKIPPFNHFLFINFNFFSDFRDIFQFIIQNTDSVVMRQLNINAKTAINLVIFNIFK